jgi:hypothetical protein
VTPSERRRLQELCNQIQVEKDHVVFTELVEELNALLEREEERLAAGEHEKPN